jgi:hypothetical protein
MEQVVWRGCAPPISIRRAGFAGPKKKNMKGSLLPENDFSFLAVFAPENSAEF